MVVYSTFHAADPLVKTFLLQCYCLSLYGCCLWSLNCPSIRLLEIALNKILRKIWHLPPRSHTAIVHCVAQVNTISNLLYQRFQSFISRALSSSSPLIRTVFNESSLCHLLDLMRVMVISSLEFLVIQNLAFPVPSGTFVVIMVYTHLSNLPLKHSRVSELFCT